MFSACEVFLFDYLSSWAWLMNFIGIFLPLEIVAHFLWLCIFDVLVSAALFCLLLVLSWNLTFLIWILFSRKRIVVLKSVNVINENCCLVEDLYCLPIFSVLLSLYVTYVYLFARTALFPIFCPFVDLTAEFGRVVPLCMFIQRLFCCQSQPLNNTYLYNKTFGLQKSGRWFPIIMIGWSIGTNHVNLWLTCLFATTAVDASFVTSKIWPSMVISFDVPGLPYGFSGSSSLDELSSLAFFFNCKESNLIYF